IDRSAARGRRSTRPHHPALMGLPSSRDPELARSPNLPKMGVRRTVKRSVLEMNFGSWLWVGLCVLFVGACSDSSAAPPLHDGGVEMDTGVVDPNPCGPQGCEWGGVCNPETKA